jgi:hypothetical protein
MSPARQSRVADVNEVPRELLALAARLRHDWERDEIWQAMYAAKMAGWPFWRIVKHLIALALRPGSEPRELRDEARATPPPRKTGEDVYARGAKAWRDAFEHRHDNAA